jgi:hypothetical protein
MSATFRQSFALLCLVVSSASLASGRAYVVDGDGDAVADEIDECLYTRPGTQVGKTGCPLRAEDADADGVQDEEDQCPYSAPGAAIDAQGCARDGDFDGVADGLDRCPRSAFAAVVNDDGCAAGESRAALAPAEPARPPAAVARPLPAPAPVPAAPVIAALIVEATPVIAAPIVKDVPAPVVAATPVNEPAPVFAPLPPPALPSSAPSAPKREPAALPTVESPLLRVQFNRNSLRLGEGDQAALRSYAKIFLRELRADPAMRVKVLAGVDYREGDMAALAAGRIAALRDALIAAGVPGERIDTRDERRIEGDALANRTSEVALAR